MPGRGTPKRTVRVSEELWRAALAKADARGEDLTSVIRRALERYVKLGDRPRKRP